MQAQLGNQGPGVTLDAFPPARGVYQANAIKIM